MAQIPMTLPRVHAIIASAFNVRAAAEPALRSRFPDGIRPRDVTALPREEKTALLDWYAHNADARTSLYTRDEARQALTESNY